MVFPCTFCGKELYSDQAKNDHENTHTKNRVICTYEGCNSSYSNSANLRRHIRDTHKADEERERRRRERKERENEERRKLEKENREFKNEIRELKKANAVLQSQIDRYRITSGRYD